MLAAAVFLTTLNRRPVPTIDGAVYASVARHIVESGDWFPMYYQGHLFAEHPPFFVWAQAASMKLFGVTDFASNLPMHFFAFLTVLLTAAIARKAGLSRGTALMAAVILCTTRDFVLSSVRGYIEPLLELCIYAGLYCVVTQFHRRTTLWSFAAAICVGLAWFAKGPPALWPTLFFPLLILWKKSSARDKSLRVAVYVTTLSMMAALAVYLVQRFDDAGAFSLYWNKQILGSALTGRGGAQTYDPLFFARILGDYYKPWWVFLVIAAWFAIVEIRGLSKPQKQIPGLDLPHEALFPRPMPMWIFLLFGAGFVGGFSLVKWRFWYYIAPAYPAFAIAIAGAIFQKAAGVLERPFFFKFVRGSAFLWIFATAVFPAQSWKDRVPEVTAFAPLITKAWFQAPVYLADPNRDHNLVSTSGEWSFHRPVEKLDGAAAIDTTIGENAAWILVSRVQWLECLDHGNEPGNRWCQDGLPLGREGEQVLVLAHPSKVKLWD
jgi:4-amino-4-deoxy-L-arabinose transferase-like glycosyltransferase